MSATSFATLLALSALTFTTSCYLSHQLDDSAAADGGDPVDTPVPVPPELADCGDTDTPDLQIRISVDVAELPSTTLDGPVLTRLEGSCGRPAVEGTTARRGEVAWAELDRGCAPYRVTLGIEGAGLRSFYGVRENLCASVTFGRERDPRVETPDEGLTTRRIRVAGLGPSEDAFIAGSELRRVSWLSRIAFGELTLSYADTGGPFDTYGLVFDMEGSRYVADDGTERPFMGALPVRVAPLWDGTGVPTHGTTLDASTGGPAIESWPFRIRFGRWLGSDGPRYAGGVVRFRPPHEEAIESPASGTAALSPSDAHTLEGEIPRFPDGPWGTFDYESITAYDDSGTPLATVHLDDATTDVSVRDVTVRPRFTGAFFSDARVELEPPGWPRARVTLSDGSRRSIVTYLDPVEPIDLQPASMPLPAGRSYDDFAFHPPFAYVQVQYVDPLSPEARVSDRIPSPAVVVDFGQVEFVYDRMDDR